MTNKHTAQKACYLTKALSSNAFDATGMQHSAL